MPGGFGMQHDIVVSKTTNTDAYVSLMGQLHESQQEASG